MDVSELIAELLNRAASYRLGGPSSEHTASLLDQAAAALTAERERADKAESDKLELRQRWIDAQARADDLTRKLGDMEARFLGVSQNLERSIERNADLTRKLGEVERAAGYTPGGHWPSAAAKIDAMRDDHANTQLNEYHLERELAEAVEVVRGLKADEIGIGIAIREARESARAFIQKEEAGRG